MLRKKLLVNNAIYFCSNLRGRMSLNGAGLSASSLEGGGSQGFVSTSSLGGVKPLKRPKMMTLGFCLPSLAELSSSSAGSPDAEKQIPAVQVAPTLMKSSSSSSPPQLNSKRISDLSAVPSSSSSAVESANAVAKTYTKSYSAKPSDGIFNFSFRESKDNTTSPERTDTVVPASGFFNIRNSTLPSPLGLMIYELPLHDLLRDMLRFDIFFRAITWRFENLKDMNVRQLIASARESRQKYRENSEIICLDSFSEETKYGLTVDINRTMQKDEFFRRDSGKQTLERLILTFLTCNPDYQYSQGMTELVAITITALQSDKLCLQKSVNVNRIGLPDDVVLMIEDSRSIEADTYEIFVRLMRYLRFLYESSGEAILNQHWNLVHHVWLKTVDPVVYLNLSAAGIEPQLYLLRWYRLFFAREFQLQKVVQSLGFSVG
eukprot:TRINITY_DN1066_c0_g1_i1.p1 TRINITY_DN1066_c0_g1~~TRINITY_DN1066_c0_g1_i1.p1  ORF type:complete len:433 (-),score=63.83 TRINITY_DN1066_c0_g1_i1:260-1558(-)